MRRELTPFGTVHLSASSFQSGLLFVTPANMSIQIFFTGVAVAAVRTLVFLDVSVHVHMVDVVSLVQESFATEAAHVSPGVLEVNGAFVLPQSAVGRVGGPAVIALESLVFSRWLLCGLP